MTQFSNSSKFQWELEKLYAVTSSRSNKKSLKHFPVQPQNHALRRKELELKRRKAMINYHLKCFMPYFPAEVPPSASNSSSRSRISRERQPNITKKPPLLRSRRSLSRDKEIVRKQKNLAAEETQLDEFLMKEAEKYFDLYRKPPIKRKTRFQPEPSIDNYDVPGTEFEMVSGSGQVKPIRERKLSFQPMPVKKTYFIPLEPKSKKSPIYPKPANTRRVRFQLEPDIRSCDESGSRTEISSGLAKSIADQNARVQAMPDITDYGNTSEVESGKAMPSLDSNSEPESDAESPWSSSGESEILHGDQEARKWQKPMSHEANTETPIVAIPFEIQDHASASMEPVEPLPITSEPPDDDFETDDESKSAASLVRIWPKVLRQSRLSLVSYELSQFKIVLKLVREATPQYEESDTEFEDEDEAGGDGLKNSMVKSYQPRVEPVVIPSKKGQSKYHNHLFAPPVNAFLQTEMEAKGDQVCIKGEEHLRAFLDFITEKYKNPSPFVDRTFLHNLQTLTEHEHFMKRQIRQRVESILLIQDILDRFDGILHVLPVDPLKNLFFVYLKEFMRKFPTSNYPDPIRTVRIRSKSPKVKKSEVLEIQNIPIEHIPRKRSFFAILAEKVLGKRTNKIMDLQQEVRNNQEILHEI